MPTIPNTILKFNKKYLLIDSNSKYIFAWILPLNNDYNNHEEYDWFVSGLLKYYSYSDYYFDYVSVPGTGSFFDYYSLEKYIFVELTDDQIKEIEAKEDLFIREKYPEDFKEEDHKS